MTMISKSLPALALVTFAGSAGAQTYYGLTELGTLGGTQGAFTNWGSVNDSGEVTGYSYLSGSQTPTAFIYSSGAMHNIVPGTSQGYGINDSGEVTGFAGTCGFTFDAGVITNLNNLVGKCGANAADSSVGVAINASGNVAGYATTSNGYAHAAYFVGGKIKDLGTLGGNSSAGYGVNSSGEVTGTAETASGASHAFITASGALTDLGTLGGSSSIGYGISATGLVTGESQISGNAATHAFLYGNGTMKGLGGLGGATSVGLAINSQGNVVGYAQNASGASRAFLFSGGSLVDLNTLINPGDPLQPYVTLVSATGISNTGYIVANGTDTRFPGVGEVFLLTLVETLPTVTDKVVGTLGANSWYVTPTTLSWTVTGSPAPTTSGCGKVSVPNTTGTTYKCTATNSVGTASGSVTIKEDTIPPTVAIKNPTNGETFYQNQTQGVTAGYGCADKISGVQSCVGPVANGAVIPTSTLGIHTFEVIATNNASSPRIR